MDATGKTTGKAFLEHWKWAADKGLMKKNTAGGVHAAVRKVLSALDNWESVDVSTLNVEQTLTQFQNKRMKDLKPRVLEEYKQRFRAAIGSYLKYLDDPGSWKPVTVERQPRATNGGKRNGADATAQAEVAGRDHSSVGLVDYPFPLRADKIVHLVLPRDLTASEVKRLTTFMNTLVVDEGGSR